jgi:hypothetical protein
MLHWTWKLKVKVPYFDGPKAPPDFFIIPFYLQSVLVLVHSANCVKDVYSGM